MWKISNAIAKNNLLIIIFIIIFQDCIFLHYNISILELKKKQLTNSCTEKKFD